MTIRRIKETCIYVTDLQRTKEFYASRLELPLLSMVNDRHVFFRAGESVLLERLFDHRVDVDELGIEVEHGLRQPSHHRRGDLLSGDGDALGIGGGDRTRCQVAGVVRVAVTQPFLEACHPRGGRRVCRS